MGKNKFDYYTPMLNKFRVKNVDGVYRNKKSGKLLKMRNMYFQGMICGDTDKPFDAYQGEITRESEVPVKNCVVDFYTFSNLEKIF